MNARLRDPDDALDRIQAELCDDPEVFANTMTLLNGAALPVDTFERGVHWVLTLPREQQSAAALVLLYVWRDRVHAALWGEAERVLSQRIAQELRDKGEAEWNAREDAA